MRLAIEDADRRLEKPPGRYEALTLARVGTIAVSVLALLWKRAHGPAIAVGRAPRMVERDRCGADQIATTMTVHQLFGPHAYEIVYGWSTRSLEVTISATSGPVLYRGDICTISSRTGYCKDFVVIEVRRRGATWSARCVAAGEELF